MSVVISVYDSVANAERTVEALLDAGYTDDNIGVVVHDSEKGSVIADDLGREYASGATPRTESVISQSTVWDRFPDDYSDVLHREGMTGDMSACYTQHLDAGDIILVVDAGDRTDDARGILRKHSSHVCERAERAPAAAPVREEAAAEYRVPVIEEEVAVTKVKREAGEVRITPEVSSRTVDIPTSVTHDEVRVERRKLEQPMTPEDYQKRTTAQKGELCLPIVEDEIEIIKRPVVREEMVITRVPVSEEQTLRETVRHTEPRIETTGEVNLYGETEKKRRTA